MEQKTKKKKTSSSDEVRLTLDVTGCRDGDLIKSADGGFFRVRFQENGPSTVPCNREKEVQGKYLGPWKSSVEKIRQDQEKFRQLVTKLPAFSLFAGSHDIPGTLESLQCSASSLNMGWGYGGWVHFEVLRLPKKVEQLLKGTPDVLDLIPTRTWVLEDLMDLIPAQTTNVQKDKVTLAFQAGNWQACFSESCTSAAKGTFVIDIESGSVLDGSPPAPHHELWPVEKFPTGYSKGKSEENNGKWVPQGNITLFIRAPKMTLGHGEISTVDTLLNALGIHESREQVEIAFEATRI